MTISTAARPLSISTEARGIVRRFKAQLDAEHRVFRAKFKSNELNDAAEKYRHAGRVGRDRAYKRLVGAFGEPHMQVGKVTVWSHLRSRDAVLVTPQDPGQAQPAVVVDYLIAGFADHLSVGLWTIEVPEHALGRLVQRCPGIDIEDAIIDAHQQLLGGDIEVLPDPGKDIAVKGGPGYFVGQIVYAMDFVGKKRLEEGRLIYFRPRTWLHEEQIEELRYPVIKEGERCLGAGPFLPLPLRELNFSNNAVSVTRKI